MYFNWSETINTKEIDIISDIIKNGEIIVFPTETVYGIGANAFDEDAVRKIFIAKGRPSDNPLIVHLDNKEKIKDVAIDITQVEQKLIDSFMPGPFTIILKKNSNIPNIVSGGLDTIGVRVPRNKIAQCIIKSSKLPIAAPSANISGKPSGTTIEEIREELENKVAAIIDGGKTKIGLESTVVKVINEVPIILRPGAITENDIKEIIGKCEIDNNVFKKIDKNKKVESPGMKYRHYAPETKCKLVNFLNDQEQILNINTIVSDYNGDVVILGFEEHKEEIMVSNQKFISLGKKNDFETIARRIYSSLRKADAIKPKIIIIEGVEKQGLGVAIMNRLLRTCEYDILEG